MPGDRPERFAKARATGADAIVIDLEDAVPPDRKRAALTHTLEWLGAGNEAVVRINGVATDWHAAEVEALSRTGAGVMLPKTESAAHLARLHDVLGDRTIALIESARGVQDADALAESPGVVRLALGNVDLSAELGIDPGSHSALAYSRGRLVMASAAAGLHPPIDGVTTALDSPSVLAADLAVTRELGLGGKLCIHPRQVGPTNDALRPTEDEVAWAHRVLEAADANGVSVVDSMMVDPPVIKRAERIIASRSGA